MIPFLDLRSLNVGLRDEIMTALERVTLSGSYILGSEVEGFEDEWARYCGVENCVGVGNGLDALHLGLLALGVGPGDEVIVPSNTYIATWLAVSACGAVPVPVEPDETTFNIDPTKIEEAITRRTRVILPVHLYGHPADMAPILELAKSNGLFVLEDAAQSHGAEYRGKRIGGHGDLVAWSFYPGKNLGALGDAGALTTRSAELADRVRMLRNYGSRQKYINDEKGWNSRLDPMQAAVLSVKLRHLDAWNAHRSEVAHMYSCGLAETALRLPVTMEYSRPAWHLYVVRVKQGDRDRLQTALKRDGVETLIHYPVPPHLQKAYAGTPLPLRGLPISERIHEMVLSLPLGPTMTIEQTQQVIASLRQHAIRVENDASR